MESVCHDKKRFSCWSSGTIFQSTNQIWGIALQLMSSLGLWWASTPLLFIYHFYTLNNAGLFHPKFGSNMDKPKCWVKNAIEKITVEIESWSWVKILNYIFNPTFGFVHIWPNHFETTQHFLQCRDKLWVGLGLQNMLIHEHVLLGKIKINARTHTHTHTHTHTARHHLWRSLLDSDVFKALWGQMDYVQHITCDQ